MQTLSMQTNSRVRRVEREYLGQTNAGVRIAQREALIYRTRRDLIMRQPKPAKVTGLNLYLALSKLDLFLTHGEGALPLPDAQLAAAVVHYDLACVADFRTQPGEHLCSELFTARAVGE